MLLEVAPSGGKESSAGVASDSALGSHCKVAAVERNYNKKYEPLLNLFLWLQQP